MLLHLPVAGQHSAPGQQRQHEDTGLQQQVDRCRRAAAIAAGQQQVQRLRRQPHTGQNGLRQAASRQGLYRGTVHIGPQGVFPGLPAGHGPHDAAGDADLRRVGQQHIEAPTHARRGDAAAGHHRRRHYRRHQPKTPQQRGVGANAAGVPVAHAGIDVVAGYIAVEIVQVVAASPPLLFLRHYRMPVMSKLSSHCSAAAHTPRRQLSSKGLSSPAFCSSSVNVRLPPCRV